MNQITAAVRAAAAKLYPTQADEAVALLLDASGVERVHRDILVLSYGDFPQLQHHCAMAKLDARDVMIAEENPEDFVGIENRPQAAAELARRYEALGFEIPEHIAYWAKHA